MNKSMSLVDNLRAIQIDCRYERKGALNTFHCYDVTGDYFDRCVEQAEHLEQRYQQLEQVARKMLKHLCSVCDGGDVYNEDIADYREGLEELGVDL